MSIEETKSFELKRGIEVWNCCEPMVIVEMVIIVKVMVGTMRRSG